jgi:thiamine biosynthesis protein ThiC
MKTQIELARAGIISEAMQTVADDERIDVAVVRERVAKGQIVIFDLIERQLADGLSFMAIHCGINQYTIRRLRKQGFRYGGLDGHE